MPFPERTAFAQLPFDEVDVAPFQRGNLRRNGRQITPRPMNTSERRAILLPITAVLRVLPNRASSSRCYAADESPTVNADDPPRDDRAASCGA